MFLVIEFSFADLKLHFSFAGALAPPVHESLYVVNLIPVVICNRTKLADCTLHRPCLWFIERLHNDALYFVQVSTCFSVPSPRFIS